MTPTSPLTPAGASPVASAGPAASAPATAPGAGAVGRSREHGTLAAFKIDRCSCKSCRAANARYVARRNRLIAYGRWEPYVDAEPVRRHVLALRDAGLGYKRVAELAGISTGAMSKLLYGDYGRGMAPSRRVRPATAQAILAVQADLDTLGGSVHVDATGTHRRVQALAALGWSYSRLAERLGVGRGNFGKTMAAGRVYAATARAVRALYDELWDQPPPEVRHREKISASRARNIAQSRGWPPPLAWDDDTIDDPAALPDVGDNPPRAVALAEDCEELLRQGYTLAQAAERLGVGRSALERARRRVREAAA